MSTKIHDKLYIDCGPEEPPGFYRAYIDPARSDLVYLDPGTPSDKWFLNEVSSDALRRIVAERDEALALRDEAIRKYDELVTKHNEVAEKYANLVCEVESKDAPTRLITVPRPGLTINSLEDLVSAVERVAKAVR